MDGVSLVGGREKSAKVLKNICCLDLYELQTLLKKFLSNFILDRLEGWGTFDLSVQQLSACGHKLGLLFFKIGVFH